MFWPCFAHISLVFHRKFARMLALKMLSLRFLRPVFSLASTVTHIRALSTAPKIVKFKTADQEWNAKAKIGDSLLDVMLNNDIPLDGFGACEGTLACCTCHVILSKEHFERQDRTNPAGEEELDLLDLAPDLNDLSRLGCQIRVETCDPDEIEVVVPSIQRDARTM